MDHTGGLVVVCCLSVVAVLAPMVGLPLALLRPGVGWPSRAWIPAVVLLASVGAHAIPRDLRLFDLLVISTWLALALVSQRRFDGVAPNTFRRPRLARLVLVGATTLSVMVAFTVLQCGYSLSAPQTWDARLLCAVTPPGSPIERFRSLAWVMGMSTLKWPGNQWVTYDTWLFMHYGCKATFDDAGNVVEAKMWSVG